MAETSTAAGPSRAHSSLLSRFVGVITSPRATFQEIAARPRWFGMLVLTTVIVALCAAGPMMTEAGRQAALDQQINQMESFGVRVTDEMYAQMERRMPYAPYTTGISILVFAPVMTLIIAGLLFVVFNAVLGGDASFKQLFSVIVHAGVVSALGQLFTAPVNMARGALGSATNVAVLLPMLDETSFTGRLLGMIDLFVVWWVLVMAIGLGVLYRRRTQPIAAALFVVYGIIAIVVALVMSRLGGA